MKRNLLLAFGITLFGSVLFQSCTKPKKSPWKKVFDLPISGSSNAPITKIQCISNSLCYILAKDGFIRSTNGGRLWIDGDTAKVITNGYRMNDFQFSSEAKGICIANDNSNTKVYGTVNGGITWTVKATSASSPALSSRVARKLMMSDSANGIIQTESNEYLSTSNGGTTWKYEGKLQFAFSNVAEVTLYKTTVTAMDFEDNIYQSADKGKTWITKGKLPGGWAGYYIASTDANTLYVDGDGWLMKSTNGGKDWMRITPEEDYFFTSVRVVNGSSIALLGYDKDYNLYIFSSADAGAKWQKVFLSAEQNYVFTAFDLKGSTGGIATIGNEVFSFQP